MRQRSRRQRPLAGPESGNDWGVHASPIISVWCDFLFIPEAKMASTDQNCDFLLIPEAKMASTDQNVHASDSYLNSLSSTQPHSDNITKKKFATDLVPGLSS
jgi:hypothetical protein